MNEPVSVEKLVTTVKNKISGVDIEISEWV